MTKIKPQEHQMKIYKRGQKKENREQKLKIFKTNLTNSIRFSVFASFTFFLITITACHNTFFDKDANLYAPFLLTRSGTIDSLIKVMTLEEKLGQLLFVETNLSEEEDLPKLSTLVKEKKISGILSSYRFTNDSVSLSLQKTTSIPLLIGLAPNNYYQSLMPSYNLSAIIEDSMKHQIVEKNQSNYSQSNYDIALDVDLRTVIEQDTSLQDSHFVKQQSDVFASSNFIINHYQENGILTGINNCVDFKMNAQPTDFYSKNNRRGWCLFSKNL